MRLFVAAYLIATGAAQVATVGVTGSVQDATAQAIPDARVMLVGAGVRQEQVTGTDGRFAFDRVPAGRYELRVTASGFLTRKVPVIVTPVGVDLGAVVLDVPCMHCEPPIDMSAPEPDCWDAALVNTAVPILSTTRLARLAVAKPLPVATHDGSTEVRILVTPSGLVACAAAVAGDPKFAAAALAAARQWRFPPGRPILGLLAFRSVRGRLFLE